MGAFYFVNLAKIKVDQIRLFSVRCGARVKNLKRRILKRDVIIKIKVCESCKYSMLAY